MPEDQGGRDTAEQAWGPGEGLGFSLARMGVTEGF